MIPDPSAAPGGPRIGGGGLAARLVVLLGAVLVVVAAGRVQPVPVASLAVGVALAVLRPTSVGAWVVVPAAAWTFGAATGADVALGPVLLAAAGVYLAHTGTAAAAVFPWSAWVPAPVVGRWLLRCVPPVVVTVVLAVLDAGIGQTPRSTLFAVAAGAVVVAAAALLYRLLTTARDDAR